MAVKLSADQQELYDHVPLDGSAIGNKALRQGLSWDEAKYWSVRDPLIEQGLLGLGKGKGGSVRRKIENVKPALAAETSVKAGGNQEAAEPTLGESHYYAKVKQVLEEKWSKDLKLEEFFVEVTAQQGRRDTGGTWTRPDVVVVSVSTYQNVPGKFVDLTTFEVKLATKCDVTAVYEALAHLRAATKAYVLVVLPPDKKDAFQDLLTEISEEAGRHGIGVIVATDIEDYGTWLFPQEALANSPDIAKLDEFIETQITDDNRKRLRKWIK